MRIEVKVPQLPESVTEATLVNWHKKAGEPVKRDENLIDVETDKVVLELPAPGDGVLIDDATWAKRKSDWLPSTDDGDFIASLMNPVSEIGKFASWISPPKVGIDNKPGDFEYVKIET